MRGKEKEYLLMMSWQGREKERGWKNRNEGYIIIPRFSFLVLPSSTLHPVGHRSWNRFLPWWVSSWLIVVLVHTPTISKFLIFPHFFVCFKSVKLKLREWKRCPNSDGWWTFLLFFLLISAIDANQTPISVSIRLLSVLWCC